MSEAERSEEHLTGLFSEPPAPPQGEGCHPGGAVLSLPPPHPHPDQMSQKPCLHPLHTPSLPDWASARQASQTWGCPAAAMVSSEPQFSLLIWTGQDQVFSEVPSSVTGLGRKVPCAAEMEHAYLD